MKKILYILASLALLAACNDGFLDKKPLDKLSEEAVFNSDALAEAYINAIYTVLPDPFTEGNIGCITDEGFFRYGGTSTRYIADGSMTPSSIIPMEDGGPAHNTRTTFLNIWNRAYEYIYRLNYFIRYVDEKGSAMTEDGKNRLLGEAYFLRAWAYTNLIQRYGGVVIVDKPFDDIGADFADTRSNFDDCVTFIKGDLDKAYDLLPEKNGTALGRVHKDCVLALRSRLTLIVASPLFNDPNFPTGSIFRGEYSKSKWQDAYDAAKAICDRADKDGAYALDDTYDGFWRDENSPEIIWGKYFVQSSGQPHKAQLFYALMDFGGGGWESFNPTQAMWLDYEMKNGKKIFEEGSGYDPKHPFKGRDPRFEHSVVYPTKIYKWTDKDGGFNETVLNLYLLYENAELADLDKSKPELSTSKKASDQIHLTNTGGSGLTKWYMPDKYISESLIGNVVYPWFRLGEMYLNMAEAAYQLGGKEDECKEYLNKVRSRADVRMPDITSSGTDLWDDVVNERRVELAFEAFRYFDTRRLKIAVGYENVPFAGMRTMLLQKGTKQDTVYRVGQPATLVNKDRNYYWANTEERTAYIGSNNGNDVAYIVNYVWKGKTYAVDYGEACLTISPTQKWFPNASRNNRPKAGELTCSNAPGVEDSADYPNYLMPIPQPEIDKTQKRIVQNPGYIY